MRGKYSLPLIDVLPQNSYFCLECFVCDKTSFVNIYSDVFSKHVPVKWRDSTLSRICLNSLSSWKKRCYHTFQCDSGMPSNFFNVIISSTFISLFVFIFLSFSPTAHTLKHVGTFSEELNSTLVLPAYQFWDVNNLDRLTSSKHFQEISTSFSWTKEMYIDPGISFFCFLYHSTQEV